MRIIKTEIWKFSIPMVPFTIATGTMEFAQNIFIRIHTDAGFYGVGECSAFPMITGETQSTCFEMARDFAALINNKDPLEIEERLLQLNDYAARNTTIKSAFDMALYDIAAKHNRQPLYEFLGGTIRDIESDLTIGIGTPESMSEQALQFKNEGVNMLKIKLGKHPFDDIQRIAAIRKAVGDQMILRVDANQGWTFDEAMSALQGIEPFDIQFCEQPMRSYNDHRLPELRHATRNPIMADESVFDHRDAARLISAGGCDYINIKFAKSGGIHEAMKIHAICREERIPCMMGGMLESRIALTAFVHFVYACPGIEFYDMDTCKLGHKADPVKGGVNFEKMWLRANTESHGIGADADDAFLASCEKIVI